jgi:hypothetical protein
MERFIAVDNVCAWPNLTLLPDGTIAAAIFNQPCHGVWEGDLECWVSVDGGYLWQRRGVIAQHEPTTNRFDCAAGLAHDGAYVALVAGYGPVPPPGMARDPTVPTTFLASWVCRSSDGGMNWHKAETLTLPEGTTEIIPFGDIVRSPNGTLAVTGYSVNDNKRNSTYFFRSRDDGYTWDESVLIGADDYNEADLLCLDEKRWLAVARTLRDQHLALFVSEDDGGSWHLQGALTLPRQHPPHLLRLANGNILMTYGIRNRGLYGIGARITRDLGESWSAPILLVDLEDASDGGYPSSVQLEDGTIVTAYYANRIKAHRRYHMGVVRWHEDE